MKHIPYDSYPQFGWGTEGFESSRESTGEGVTWNMSRQKPQKRNGLVFSQTSLVS